MESDSYRACHQLAQNAKSLAALRRFAAGKTAELAAVKGPLAEARAADEKLKMDGVEAGDFRRQELAVYSNWTSIGANGLVPDPSVFFKGGHAVLVMGYDDAAQRFKFQNSWSDAWGDQGYGDFTYDYMTSHSWSSWGAERL